MVRSELQASVSHHAPLRSCAIARPMTDAPQTPAEKMKAILAAKQGGAARAGQGSGAAGRKQGEAMAAARSFSKSKPALRK
jgi:hypothetical protein